jgi:guanine nucleotide-binding protein G(i) subunit alpha
MGFPNIILALRTLTFAANKLGFSLLPENKERATFFTEPLVPGAKLYLDEKLSGDVKALWNDPAIQSAFKESYRFQLSDSTAYFMEQFDRISEKSYIPNTDDILHCRSKTVGICEIAFQVEDAQFKMVDVGGQRSERTKWIYCFEDVTAILFFVALSEYNLTLFEDPSVNRMHESLKLFDEIVNAKWFVDTPIILFLNKSDIFREKIKDPSQRLSITFPDYKGENTFEDGCDFVRNKFVCLNEAMKTKNIFTHVTCCTDTNNIRVVFDAVRQTLLNELLKSLDMIV